MSALGYYLIAALMFLCGITCFVTAYLLYKNWKQGGKF